MVWFSVAMKGMSALVLPPSRPPDEADLGLVIISESLVRTHVSVTQPRTAKWLALEFDMLPRERTQEYSALVVEGDASSVCSGVGG